MAGTLRQPLLGEVAQPLHDLAAVIEQHRFLVGVVVEKSAARDVARPRDVGGGGALKPPLFEEVDRHVIDAGAAAFFLPLPK